MSETVSSDAILPGLNPKISIESFSGCCAILLNGVPIGNGALLWSGQHIITAARVVNGLTSLSPITFQFDTVISYSVPGIEAITLHPDYTVSGDVFDHNLAIITLSSPITAAISRYSIACLQDATMRKFVRRTYGKLVDPSTGQALGVSPSYWMTAVRIPSQYLNNAGGVCANTDGSLYVTGTFVRNDFYQDSIISKYTSDGDIIWRIRLSNAAQDNQVVNIVSICPLSDGGIVICGHSSYIGIVIKLSSSGEITWKKTFPNESRFYEVSTNTLGEILVIGDMGTYPPNTGVIKLSSSGNLIWEKYVETQLWWSSGRYGTTSVNNIYVAGNIPHPSFNQSIIALYKYSDAGDYLGYNTLGGDNSSTVAYSVYTFTTDSYVYLIGTLEVSGEKKKAIIASFNSNMTLNWVRSIGNSTLDCEGCGIVAEGNDVYITAKVTEQTPWSIKMMVAKYDSSGTLQWQRLLSGVADSNSGFNDFDSTAINVASDDGLVLSAYIYDYNWDPLLLPIRLSKDGGHTGTYSGCSYSASTIPEQACTILSYVSLSVAHGALSDSMSDADIVSYSQSVNETFISIEAGSSTPTWQFSTNQDVYELCGIWHAVSSKSGTPITYAAQLVYDFDDGTLTRDTIKRFWSSSQDTRTQVSDGFITPDSYGSASFIDGGIAGIAGNILCESPPSYASSSTPGCYGSVAYDAYIAYYKPFIEGIIGYASDGFAIDNQIGTVNFLRSNAGEVLTSPKAIYDSEIGTYILQSDQTGSFVLVSQNYGATWKKITLPFTYNPPSSYGYCQGVAKYNGRWIACGQQTIWTSDNEGVTWTLRHSMSSSSTGPAQQPPFRHPITGVWCVGAFGGRVYHSIDDGINWIEQHIATTYTVEFLYHVKSTTIIGKNFYGVYTSTNGIDWVYRAPTGENIVAVGDCLFSPGSAYPNRVRVSVDGGVTWHGIETTLPSFSDYSTPINYFYVLGAYYAIRPGTGIDSGSRNYVSKSTNGIDWVSVGSLSNWLDFSATPPLYFSGGGGLIAGLDDSPGFLYVSEDGGGQWKCYDSLVIDFNTQYKSLEYVENTGIWIATNNQGIIAYTSDPRAKWTFSNVLDFYGASGTTLSEITVTPESILVNGNYDTYYLRTDGSGIFSPPGNFAEKTKSILGSGLLGIISGSTQFSGTLLKTGMHILTSAHAVSGITSGDFSAIQIVFNVSADITISDPVVTEITIHPNYSTTINTANWINYDLAIIHLQTAVDARVSRYDLYSGDELIPRVFDKTAYGHAWDPINGVAEVDTAHFISFKNRYESLGLPLQGLGIPYIADSLHLLYDYDDGSAERDAIGESTGFSNQPSNTGLGVDEGFTAPGRSGSAGLLDGKIAGVTFGTFSIAPYDINGTANDATYGEIGIDIRVSQFSVWISNTAGFGADIEGSLPGFSSSSNLWFTEPVGLEIDGVLSYPTGMLLAAEPEQFNVDDYLPGLDNDFAMVSPWQAEGDLPLMLCDMQLKPAETFTLDKTLTGLSIDFTTVANGDVALQSRFPSLLSDIMLEASNRFEWSTMLSLDSDIAMGLAGEFALSHRLPSLTAELSIASDLSISGYLPGITGDLSAYAASISIQAKLPELNSEIGIVSYTVSIEGSLSGITCEMPIDSLTCEFSGAFNGLMGSMSLAQAKLFSIDYTLPSLLPESVIESINIEDMASETILPGLHGFINARFSNPTCSTRYL